MVSRTAAIIKTTMITTSKRPMPLLFRLRDPDCIGVARCVDLCIDWYTEWYTEWYIDWCLFCIGLVVVIDMLSLFTIIILGFAFS